MDPKSRLLISTGFLLMVSTETPAAASLSDQEFFGQVQELQTVLRSWPSLPRSPDYDESQEWRQSWYNFGNFNNGGGWRNY